jgi:3-hydroxybutyrate dehydrogenase
MSLQCKNAPVTGSTSGIGRGIADALAALGANVMLNGLGDEAATARIQLAASVDELPLDKREAILAIDSSAAFHATRTGAVLPINGGWTAH